MHVRDVLLAVLASVPLTACQDSRTPCEPDTQEFSIDEPLSPEQLDHIVATFDLADREAITCELACEWAYYGLEVTVMDSCGLCYPPSRVARAT